MDKNYFPNFCGSPCLSFVHLIRTEGVFTAHQVEFSNKNGKIRAFWNVRNSVIVLFLFFFFFFWYFELWGLMNRGVFGLEQCHCLSAGSAWFVQHQIKCPYPNQVFRQPLLLFFLFCFFPSCFEDEAFCVSTGYRNLWCPFSLVCRRKC